MKLITYQTKDALKSLQKKGILVTDVSYMNSKKSEVPYSWLVGEMKRHKISPKNGELYPIWAWAKCGATIAPRKKKNYFKTQQKKTVRITFEKPDTEVFLSDYMAYSFILSGHIVPKTIYEYQHFLKKIPQDGISLESLKQFVRREISDVQLEKAVEKIKKTWPRIFDLKSSVIQACVWHIKLSEVVKIEILNDSDYLYGSMNTKRKDGSRPNWKKKYLTYLSD